LASDWWEKEPAIDPPPSFPDTSDQGIVDR